MEIQLGTFMLGIIGGLGIAWLFCIIICVLDQTINDYREDNSGEL